MCVCVCGVCVCARARVYVRVCDINTKMSMDFKEATPDTEFYIESIINNSAQKTVINCI